jgi:cephalosporin hydroxylase
MEELVINFEKNTVTILKNGNRVTHSIGSPEAFSAISSTWLRSGWDTKYVYGFTWLGRPIIQLPEDMFRIQEVICFVKPDVILETGVAHGGSLIFYASLCKAMDHGRVVGIDIDIRPHNRKAIEAHQLYDYITLIEGDSIDDAVLTQVKSLLKPTDRAFVVLDSNHTKQHVLGELRAYSKFVAVDSYIVACDGIMETLVGAPRSSDDWSWNNPKAAAEEFTKNNKNFIMEEPEFLFNEGSITERVTYWPSAFLRRTK